MISTESPYQKKFQEAIVFLQQRDYHSLADLVREDFGFAHEQGQNILHKMFDLNPPPSRGHCLTGTQLWVLGYLVKANTGTQINRPISFEYVARIGRSGREYVSTFPDFKKALGVEQGDDFKEIHYNSARLLKSLIIYHMRKGKPLPEPEYRGRKTRKTSSLIINLAIQDLEKMIHGEERFEWS